jgi:hypothetical protein
VAEVPTFDPRPSIVAQLATLISFYIEATGCCELSPAFVGSDAGGERAAAIYSLIGSAKLNGIDPEA